MDSKDSSGAQSANETPTLNVENRRMTRSATRALQQQQAGPAAAGVSEKDDQAPPLSTIKTQKASKIKKEESDDEKPKKTVRGKKQAKKNLTAPATNKKRKATEIKKEETDEEEDDEKPMKAVLVKKELDIKENLSAFPANNKRKASEITKDEDDDDYKPEQASDIKDEDHTPKKVAPVKKMMKLGGEKRLRKFRDEPPKHWQGVYDRAQTERFYVLNRTRVGTESRPEEYVEMTGSTGNIYTVHIGLRITCTCPHHMRGFAQCKHICFVSSTIRLLSTILTSSQVMKKVLNAPDELLYQQALLSTELQSIFESAPDISASQSESQSQEESDKRKPIEGDCPICYCELKKEDEKKPSLVWCAAACGHNFHSQCFKLWARNKSGAGVTCPMCRSAWKGDGKLEAVVEKSKAELSEGYLNVGDQLGVGRVRGMLSLRFASVVSLLTFF